MSRSLLFAFLIFTSVALHAHDLPQGVRGMDFGFVAPNEFYPARSIEPLNKIQEGVLISVGTERALMTAILNKKITSILQVDFDKRVVRYNRVNLELLKLSRDREDYMYLRMNADVTEWIRRANAAGHSIGFTENFSWWRDALGDPTFLGFHTNWSEKALENPPFLGAHYLYDDKAFAYIKKFAIENRIRVQQGDLSNFVEMQKLIEHIKGPIAVIDISNAWQEAFAGAKAVYELSLFVGRKDPKAIFLATQVTTADWVYISFPAGEFNIAAAAPHKGAAKFLVSAVRKTCNLLLGGGN